MQPAKCFEVYLPDGVLIFRAYIVEREFLQSKGPAPQPELAPTVQPTSAKQNGDAMTSSQRRFIFRLFALQGVEGEKAEAELRRELKVTSLKEITKHDASRLIEQLLAKKGGNGHGSSLQ